jgi:hypothetical protein
MLPDDRLRHIETLLERLLMEVRAIRAYLARDETRLDALQQTVDAIKDLLARPDGH